MIEGAGPPPWPVDGEPYAMPDGTTVTVASWALDHTGLRVNEVQVWARPPAPERARPISPGRQWPGLDVEGDGDGD